jgi:hypothetical protein
MNTFVYRTCLALVGLSLAVGWGFPLLRIAGVKVSFSALSLLSFATLIPPFVSGFVPILVHQAVGYLMLFLFLRRIWLIGKNKESVPPSFRAVSKGLAYLGVFCILLALLTLLVIVIFGQSGGVSGVPIGLALFPALFCIPWAFFLTELFSFRRSPPSEAQPGVPAERRR